MSESSDSVPSDNSTTQEQPARAGRDEKGRFTRGNKGGPGNPFNRRVAALRQLLLERVSDDDLAAIVDRLVQQAKEGDLGAAKLVLAYAVGRPAAVVEPDRLDVEEMELYQAETLTAEQATAPLNGTPAALACTLIRASLPAMEPRRCDVLGAGLRASVPGVEPALEQPQAESATEAATGEEGGAAKPKAKRKASREDKKPRAAQPAEAAVGPELLSVEEIRALGRGLPTAATALLGQEGSAADSKPDETARRCANPEQ